MTDSRLIDAADAPVALTQVRGISRFRKYVPLITLAIMFVITAIVAPGYMQPQQIGGLMQLAAILGVAAIGQTLVILIGGIDLSIGAVITLTNLMAAAAISGDNSRLPVGVAIALGVGLFVGVCNGAIVRFLRVPDLVATLASMTIVTGAGLLLTGGSPKGSSSSYLNAFMGHRIAGVITGGLILWVAMAVLTMILLRQTPGGRYVYAVGLNRQASRYSAVPVGPVVILIYALSGLTGGAAGLMLTGYTGAAYLASGDSYQMQTIAAVILGGTSMFGGRGSYGGTVIGVLITVLLISSLRVIGIAQAGQTISYGVVILLMLFLFTRLTRQQDQS